MDEVKAINGKFKFLFEVGKDGNLAKLVRIQGKNGKIIGTELFNEDMINFARARIPNFIYHPEGVYFNSFKKINEQGIISEGITVEYKVYSSSLDL